MLACLCKQSNKFWGLKIEATCMQEGKQLVRSQYLNEEPDTDIISIHKVMYSELWNTVIHYIMQGIHYQRVSAIGNSTIGATVKTKA